MTPRPLRIFWIDAATAIPGRIAVMPRPMPDQFMELRRAGVDVVVSLMEEGEAADIGLGDEAGLCATAGMEFLSLPVIDHGIPRAVTPIERMSRKLSGFLRDGKCVAVHCFAGLGRSPLLCAAILIDRGLGTIEACDLISTARGVEVPEMDEQIEWLHAYERFRRGGRSD